MADLTGAIQLRKTAAETINNSNTLQDDDDFTFSVAASEVWTVEIHASVSFLLASDFKFTFALPTGASMVAMGVARSISGHVAATGTTPGTAIALASGADIIHLDVYALLIMSTTAGTAKFQWAQNTAVAEDTSILANSFLLAAKEA